MPLHDIMNHDLAAHNVAFTDGVQEAVHLTNPQRRYIATTTRPVKRGDSLRDTYATVDDNIHFVVFYDFALHGVPTFTAVDASVVDLAAEIAQIGDARREAGSTSTLVVAAEAQRALLAALQTVPERAMQQVSMATLGAAGAAHPVAMLGGASGLHDLVRPACVGGVVLVVGSGVSPCPSCNPALRACSAGCWAGVVPRATPLLVQVTPGLLALLEICIAPQPQVAVTRLRERDWQPQLELQRSPAAVGLLLGWAQKRRCETSEWLATRAYTPPPSLPAHRHRDSVTLAEEADEVLRQAVDLLERAMSAAPREDAMLLVAGSEVQRRVADAVAASKGVGAGRGR